MQSWQQLGPHRYRMAQRFLHWEPHGAIQPAEMPQLLALFDQVGIRTQQGIVLFDQRSAAPAGSVVRRMMMDYLKEARPHVFCLFVGAPLAQRAFNQLLIGAARRLLGYEVRYAHFNSVEEALRFADHMQGQAPPT